ncbi:hypothetical protein Poli38472_002034 [Pythium oligandrum]|uniref:Flavin-containing monooxygenase n=1 Tax=Pythium oligandrum TaxID=41045 RepID=A0A8K1CHI8_PYTOL|nr:hypothetical protein Poli38472_002034 [Pythium oligandrum]|eukprot:TMW63093.1 hypothetical protein Poli38472_002034 [Pythium oligandrum]
MQHSVRTVRVGIIGGGAAGVIAAKCLRDGGHSVVVFEKSGHVGGVWRYDEATHTDASMYKSLRTNLPTAVMQLDGFPFPSGLRSFPSHTDVLAYIQDYARHYHVNEVVRLDSNVTAVHKLSSGQSSTSSPSWSISVTSSNGKEYSEQVDKVLVCNGHFAVPFYSSIPGAEHFKGEILHSHDYRTHDSFLDKRVLLVGKGPSGQDISLELANAGAKEVIVSYKSEGNDAQSKSDRRVLKPQISHFAQSGRVVFEDGSSLDAPDVLMYCTGYLYSVKDFAPSSMLYPELQVPDQPAWAAELEAATRDGHAIAPLYKDLFAIEEPDVAFIGVLFKNLPFVCFELQAKWASMVFSGQTVLPSKQQMYDEFFEQIQSTTRPLRKLHQLGERQESYFMELAKLSGTTYTPHRQVMFEDAGSLRATHPLYYREAEYTFDGDRGHWKRRLQIPLENGESQDLVRVFD